MNTMTTTLPALAATPQTAVRRKARGYVDRPGFVVYGCLVAVLLGSVFPLWWSFVIGSSDKTAVNSANPPLVPGGNFWRNAATVIDSIPFWKAFGNSLAVSTGGRPVGGVLLHAGRLRLRQAALPGKNGLLVFVIATMAVPPQLGVVPLFIVISKIQQGFGLQAGIWTVIFPSLVSAFGVFWMTQYLRESLPDELIEAARVDGCSMIKTFWHVCLPAARPAAAMLGLFTFVSSWTNFFWPFIVLDPQNPTLPVALQQLQAAYFVDYSLVLCGVVLATLPLLALFIVAGRQLVSGIMAGAVKG